MSIIQTQPPADPEGFRRSLYGGDIYLLDATPATERLAADVYALLQAEFGEPVREAQFRLSGEEFFRAVGRLRKILYEEARFFQAMQEVVSALGFKPDENAFDPLRLRVSVHGGHENPKAAPIYYTHRDTWYSHPQCQVSWWMPLHDVTEAETFVFFPEYFNRPVANDSAAFDYDEWTRDRRSLRVGWQDPNAGTRALYPGHFGSMEGAVTLPFAGRAGQILVFAGAQLHKTIPNLTGRTRFSVDFRTVHLEDYRQGIGAPNADSRSTGSALVDYFHPEKTPARKANAPIQYLG